MISNTTTYYKKALSFQNKRLALVTKYENNLQKLERFKGSSGYIEDTKKLKEKHDAELKALIEEYRPGFQTIFGGMTDAIGKRSVKAPSNEEVNLLNVLRMKKKVTLEECQRTAQAVKNNPVALSVVTEIAHDSGILESFDELCPEMSSERASNIVTAMSEITEDFLQYSTTKASRLASRHHADVFGGTDGSLTKRPIFSDKTSCFSELFQLDGEEFEKFSAVVDGDLS